MRLVVSSLLVAAVLGTATGLAAHGASVKVVRAAPLTIRGKGFHSNERVVLTAAVNGRHVRVVHASPSGGFRVVFRRVRLERCAPFAVTAIGDQGSRAAARYALECPVAPRVRVP